MEESPPVAPGRLRRLAEELAEERLGILETARDPDVLLVELDYALRPPAHERRIPSYGSIVVPVVDPAEWENPTSLRVTRRGTHDLSDDDTRLFADGLSSWAVRGPSGIDELVVFDRAAGSERDLVVIAGVTGGTVVQRHPYGTVRVVGSFGVARWENARWHREPPITAWLDTICDGRRPAERAVLVRLLEFAVHDLGARGIGALLIYHPDDATPLAAELRAPVPPPLQIERPSDLAPLHHVLAQVDGAVVFDAGGTLRRLGVRLVPSPSAETDVDVFRGTRHTAARRYSYDDPAATVIVVSEAGPVTVLRNGHVLPRPPAPDGR